MSIYAHCLVRNEGNFIWYSVASVIEHVDKVLIWDNGSSDKTIQIINELIKHWPSKIVFKRFSGSVSDARQDMIQKTNGDWFIVLDGDEIWWEDSIKNVVEEIKINNQKLDSIVVPFKNLINDMFHYQKEVKGRYKIDDKEGFITIRAINRKIKGLNIGGDYPHEGYCDINKTFIQDLSPERRLFLDAQYLHLTHLKRSSVKSDKLKYRPGLEFPYDFYYPEVLFRSRPAIVPTIWTK